MAPRPPPPGGTSGRPTKRTLKAGSRRGRVEGGGGGDDSGRSEGVVMGGLGSTRWGWHRAKPRAEDHPRLTISALRRAGALRPGAVTAGTVTWRLGRGRTAAVGFGADPRDGHRPAVWLAYRVGGDPSPVRYAVPLDATGTRAGGRRWWLACPLAADGRACGRRASDLYLRRGYFGCRQCQELSYESSQTSDRRVAAAAKAGVRGEDLLGYSLRDMDFKLKILAREMRVLDRLAHRFGDGTDEPMEWPFGRVRPGPPVVAVQTRH